jgi:hypothetical protein
MMPTCAASEELGFLLETGGTRRFFGVILYSTRGPRNLVRLWQESFFRRTPKYSSHDY